MKRNPRNILFAFMMAASVAGAASTNTASFVGNCRSFQLENGSQQQPSYGTIIDYFTTYNSSTSYPLFDNTTLTFSGEVRPRAGEPGIYEGAYVITSSVDGLLSYGRYTLNLPTTDSDGDGLPDFTELSKAVNTSFTGTATPNYPSGASAESASGNFQRASNQVAGTYTLSTSQQSVTGNWQLVTMVGSAAYTRGITNTLTLTLVRGASSLTGSTTFTVVNTNQLVLPEFKLTGGTETYTVIAGTTFNRTGNKYIADASLLDGDLQTYWPDYTNWVFEITDTNDSDGNGVPDLSSTLQTTPPFFTGETALGSNWYYLHTGATYGFGYFNTTYFPYIFHLDMGWEYFVDAANDADGAYFYDFTDGVWFYTDPAIFPNIYDLKLDTWLFYDPQSGSTNRYTSDPRLFYDYSTKTNISHL